MGKSIIEEIIETSLCEKKVCHKFGFRYYKGLILCKHHLLETLNKEILNKINAD